MATITLNDVKKNFGPTHVIHGISAGIADGEFIVIVGPSGCGKSTLLRMVAGLETISSGEVLINDARANDKEPMDRDVAMVFQNYALYPHMSVRQNMGYGLKIAKMPKDQIKAKVEEVAAMLQLSPLLDRKPKQLSGGQRQRVAMGRAIVREPAVFLFDEPLSNLDAKLRVQMRLEIKELQSKLGITAMYVTHDQVEAMTMADRMIVMNAGVVEQIGTPLEVYETPRTLFAAQFIGSPAMNIVDAEVKGGQALVDGRVVTATAGPDGPVKLGIRPEHMDVAEDGPLHALVQMTEPLGANTLFHSKLTGSSESFTISLQGVHAPSSHGQTMRFAVQPGQAHIFDAETGLRRTT
ncbi:sn-glycerol-3-phosphate ABC transporter ATP-binding protein UgpC [uncultured Tateyamaria sp.]|uniref:ABC transporter ATP-binding protein n=1 Tax=uncultured Tateyamaria sp. TaxID=455651 RepID=UPI00263831E6|nr:sn-glycerol-3-phosphate ABC transporter ATP-binding protein UgpC [uncultured Tateyamaria sp.]